MVPECPIARGGSGVDGRAPTGFPVVSPRPQMLELSSVKCRSRPFGEVDI